MDDTTLSTLADVGHQHIIAGDGTETLLSTAGDSGDNGHHIIFTGEDGQSKLSVNELILSEYRWPSIGGTGARV